MSKNQEEQSLEDLRSLIDEVDTDLLKLLNERAKCVIKIVPQETKCNTFQMDKKCVKERK